MNLDSFLQFLQQVQNFLGTFNLTLLGFLFLICFVGEFHISVPYILETIWLLSGANLVHGTLLPYQMVILWLVAQSGRQLGATSLFYLSMLGSKPLVRLYQKFLAKRVNDTMTNPDTQKGLSARVLHSMNHLTPFLVAVGRLLWLRIPLTMALGIQRKLKVLSLGVLISGIIWDGIYIIIGAIVGSKIPKPSEMVLYSLAGLTVFYGGTLLFRQIRKQMKIARERLKKA